MFSCLLILVSLFHVHACRIIYLYHYDEVLIIFESVNTMKEMMFLVAFVCRRICMWWKRIWFSLHFCVMKEMTILVAFVCDEKEYDSRRIRICKKFDLNRSLQIIISRFLLLFFFYHIIFFISIWHLEEKTMSMSRLKAKKQILSLIKIFAIKTDLREFLVMNVSSTINNVEWKAIRTNASNVSRLKELFVFVK
jgi:hypothetical protein